MKTDALQARLDALVAAAEWALERVDLESLSPTTMDGDEAEEQLFKDKHGALRAAIEDAKEDS